MEGYVTIRLIADDIYDHPLLQDLNFERIVNYAVKFMKKVGIPDVFAERVADIDIKDYRALLPCDFFKIIQVKCGHTMFRSATDSFHMEGPDLGRQTPMQRHSPELTYKIQGNVIFTSMKEGKITISYKAILVDDEGFPLIPEDETYKDALFYYIKQRAFENLFDEGKVTAQQMEKAERDYCWAVGQASTHMIMPSFDEMESFTNMWTTSIARVTEHKRGFANLGTKEYLRRQ